MKKLTIAAVAAFALATGSASAADLVTKAKPIVAPEPPAWDIAFGSAIASDYIFRGVTQSNHQASVAAYCSCVRVSGRRRQFDCCKLLSSANPKRCATTAARL